MSFHEAPSTPPAFYHAMAATEASACEHAMPAADKIEPIIYCRRRLVYISSAATGRTMPLFPDLAVHNDAILPPPRRPASNTRPPILFPHSRAAMLASKRAFSCRRPLIFLCFHATYLQNNVPPHAYPARPRPIHIAMRTSVR